MNFASHALGWPVERYIAAQRDRLAKSAAPLGDRWKRRLRVYFDEVDLERTRVVCADPLPIPDPPFFKAVKRIGLDFPRSKDVAGVTFDNVIALREIPTANLLFHELVHVVQYRVLGVKEFARLYARGFLSTLSYDLIPLELCAFELEHRFTTGESLGRVEAEVRDWAARGRF